MTRGAAVRRRLAAAALLGLLSAGVVPALAKCISSSWVELDPLDEHDHAASWVVTPCEVWLEVSQAGGAASLLEAGPDGTVRRILLTGADPSGSTAA